MRHSIEHLILPLVSLFILSYTFYLAFILKRRFYPAWRTMFIVVKASLAVVSFVMVMTILYYFEFVSSTWLFLGYLRYIFPIPLMLVLMTIDRITKKYPWH